MMPGAGIAGEWLDFLLEIDEETECLAAAVA